MTWSFKDGVRRYAIAIFATVAATWLRQALAPELGPRVPFGIYLLAVLLSAWLAGTGPALVTLVLGIFSAAHFVMPPENSLLLNTPADVLALLVYSVVGLVAITLFHRSSSQHDVTRGQLKQIEILTEELLDNDRRKDQFLAMLAHELRNPLAALRSNLALLRRSELDEPRRQDVVQTATRQLGQLVHIVDDLVDVSRFLHGRIDLNLQPLDLRDAVESAVEQTRHEFELRMHDLQISLPERPVLVQGDSIRIVQIISNLLTNAAKYTPREGRIQLEVRPESDRVAVHVVDNGIGIPREIRGEIFELFARSEAATRRDAGGLGLGLALARQFAEMHGGRLVVSSEGEGCGSEFVLSLPCTAPNSSNSEKADADQHASAPSPELVHAEDRHATSRVLLIEDNRDAAESLAAWLTFDGFVTQVVHDGARALSMFREFRPGVVLLDIGLPGMDGYEIASRLRAQAGRAPLRIIAITGWGGPKDVERSRAAGIDVHLVKPVDPQELTSLLRDEKPVATRTALSPK